MKDYGYDKNDFNRFNKKKILNKKNKFNIMDWAPEESDEEVKTPKMNQIKFQRR